MTFSGGLHRETAAYDVDETTMRTRTIQRHVKHHVRNIIVDQSDNGKAMKSNLHQHTDNEWIHLYIKIQTQMANNMMHLMTRRSC